MKAVTKRLLGVLYIYSCLFTIPLPFIALSDIGIVSFCNGNVFAWSMIIGSILVYIFHFGSFLLFGNKYQFEFVIKFCFQHDLQKE